MLLAPVSTVPSAASLSPAATIIRMPGASVSAARHSVVPSGFSAKAPGAVCFNNAWTPSRARSRMTLSSTRPTSRKNSSITAPSK